MKKIVLIFLSALILNLALSAVAPISFAGNKQLEETTFNVTKILKLPDVIDENGKVIKSQEARYFNNPNGPVIGLLILVLDFATAIIGSIAILILIIAGFRFMFAAGNQQQLDESKDMLKYAVIGLAVTFISYILVIFVQSIFTTEPIA